jgi:hypothetical protein
MRCLFIAAALCFAASAADAQQIYKVAAAGKPMVLNRAWNLNPDCSADGVVTTKVLVPPQHGRISIGPARFFPTYPTSHPRSHCNQRRVAGSQATYVSQRGYTGRDHAVIEVIFPSGRYTRHSYGIAVR